MAITSGRLEVWKFPIEFSLFGEFRLEMPAGARILTVQTQNGNPCIWALVDPDAMTVGREFCLVATGEPIRWQGTILDYIGSFQIHEGKLVFHLFTRHLP